MQSGRSPKYLERSSFLKGLPGFSLFVFLLLGNPAFALERQALQGHVPAAVTRLAPISDLDSSKRLNLAIGLPPRDKPGLTRLVEQLYDPASPNFRKYLTPEQFAATFGPTEQDYQQLVDFAQANGLTITVKHPNRLLLDVNGSVADIEKAFHLKLHVYQHPTEARTFYAPDVEPSLDGVAVVGFIGGLNNYAVPQPMNVKISPEVQPNVGSAPDGNYMGTDFRNAYAPGVALTGAGQAVALVQFDGFYQSDITAYETLAGLPNVPLQTVLLNGYDGTPSGSSGNLEVSLDIEMVISMAPGITKIILYEAGPTGLAEDVLSRIANDNLAAQISSSWNWPGYDPNSEAIYLQFATQGQTFFNATGDHDAFVGTITQTPSDDPYIVQVGGTALTMTGLGAGYASETVWNRGGIGSSGGISTSYAIPGWQKGISMSANLGSTTMRNVPDVAMVADGVYVKFGNGANGSFGGTSFAAPLWAGFNALMNQQAVAAGRPPVGFINPAIYQLGTNANYGSCFHDITVGNNTSSSSPDRFYAVAGYDLCTGWGTPTGSNLINAIAGPPLTGPLISATSLTLVGETCPNGAFDPGETVTVSFGLKNRGVTDTSNLVATLQTTGGILSPSSPASYGVLASGGAEVTRLFTFSANGSCSGTDFATLQLQDGAANLGTVTVSFRLGQQSTSPILSQNFDSLSPPALPTGWTTFRTGAGPAWATTNGVSDSSPNSVFARDPNFTSDNSLTTTPFAISGPGAQLSFRHNFYTETFYDGGALEISIGAGAFTDILAAGGFFLTNGYTHNILNCCGNPLAGRGAWTGDSAGFITSTVVLPSAAVGRSVRLRWRFGSNNTIAANGWYIDTISVVDGYSCCTPAPPLIQSITTLSNAVSIVWTSIPGRTYRLQYQSSFSDSNWTDMPGDVTAIGVATSMSDMIGIGTQRFYRVMLVP